MIYRMQITVGKDKLIPMVERDPVEVITMSDGGVIAQTKAEQEMVAEAFKQQVLDLIRLMSPPMKEAEQ